jgi:hypothetical protein
MMEHLTESSIVLSGSDAERMRGRPIGVGRSAQFPFYRTGQNEPLCLRCESFKPPLNVPVSTHVEHSSNSQKSNAKKELGARFWS